MNIFLESNTITYSINFSYSQEKGFSHKSEEVIFVFLYNPFHKTLPKSGLKCIRLR